MKGTKWFLSMVLCAVTAACSIPQRPVNVYDKDGVRFDYHPDWKITEDQPFSGASPSRIIMIDGPNYALLTIHLVPNTVPTTLEEFANTFANKRADGIKKRFFGVETNLAPLVEGTSENTTALISGEKNVGNRQRFTVPVHGKLVPCTAEFFMLRRGRYKVFLLALAINESIESSRAALQKIYDTLTLETHQ